MTEKLATIAAGGQLQREKLDLASYRHLMSYPKWNFFTQSLVESRSYEKGLDACLILLRYAEENCASLSRQEYEDNLQSLYFFLLTLLDKLDKWEDYLTLWESLRQSTTMTVPYDSAALRNHGERIRPFVLSEEGNTTQVHFLYLISHRKEIIERKLCRKRSGRKIGNLLHGQQDELSKREIRRRLEHVELRHKWSQQISDLIKQARAGREAEGWK